VRPVRVGIVGAGPAGLAAAILLRQKGVDAELFERREGHCSLPQAHVVNTRTSEILRDMGLFDAVVAAAAPADKIRFITWSESLAGVQFGRLPYQGSPEQFAVRRQSSPAWTLNIAQDKLESIMAAGLKSFGGSVCFGHSIVDAEVSGTRALLTIRAPDGNVRSEIFDYVLACDGANSTVRKGLRIDMEGPASLARFASAYFTANLDKYLGDRSGPVHFIAGPDVRGAVIGFDLETTWAIMCVMPPDADPGQFSCDVMRELICRSVGDPNVKIDLIGVGSWNMSAQVAAEFRRGPFFLVGDAAHRFPPTGGLGLNTGIQDAHNIAWKLAFIAQGLADEKLLDSYGLERRPIALRNRDHSLKNALRMAEVDDAIGASTLAPVDPAVVNHPPSPSAASGLQINSNDSDAKRRRIQNAIDDQRPHFDSLEMEIGYQYDLSDMKSDRQHTTHVYRPKLSCGRLLPHFFLNTEDGITSSLDVYTKTGFTLFAGGEVHSWGNMAREVLGQAVPLKVTRIDSQLTIDRDWRSVMGIEFEGAFLVRPDGHIAWRTLGEATESSRDSLGRAVRNLFINLPMNTSGK
jgi:2,4-dichlorophenol 6-monooxygenase